MDDRRLFPTAQAWADLGRATDQIAADLGRLDARPASDALALALLWAYVRLDRPIALLVPGNSRPYVLVPSDGLDNQTITMVATVQAGLDSQVKALRLACRHTTRLHPAADLYIVLAAQQVGAVARFLGGVGGDGWRLN